MTVGHPRQDQACVEWRERLENFVDGELPAEEAEAVRAHLCRCNACLGEAKALADLSQGLRALSTAKAPVSLWDSIAARIDEPRPAATAGTAGAPPVRLSRRALTALAAGCAAVTVAGAYALLPSRTTIVNASVNDFITYRARGWTVDHAASDARSLTAWAQARVTFAVPEVKSRYGAFNVGGVRLCWLLNRRLLGLTYASGDDRAVVYIMDAHGLALPMADRELPSGRRASIHQVKGHSVAVWTENDLVFVLVAAEKDFARALELTSQRSEGSLGSARWRDRDTS